MRTDRFDFDDYDRNPGKYELFRAAKSKQTFTNDGMGDRAEGEVVSVKFLRHTYSPFYSRTVPVYEVDGSMTFGPTLYEFTL